MSQSKITISVQNVEGVNRALRQYGDKAVGEISKAVRGGAITFVNDIRRAIQGPPKTGTVYTRGNITHRASAPGEAPATDTGALASAIFFTMPEPLTAIVAVRAGDVNKESKTKPLEYAVWLEFGTQKMRPRPAWVPAVERTRPFFQKLVEDAIRRAAQ